MDPDTTMGLGLAVLGIGAPATVALIKLLPQRLVRIITEGQLL